MFLMDFSERELLLAVYYLNAMRIQYLNRSDPFPPSCSLN